MNATTHIEMDAKNDHGNPNLVTNENLNIEESVNLDFTTPNMLKFQLPNAMKEAPSHHTLQAIEEENMAYNTHLEEEKKSSSNQAHTPKRPL